jgi:hypothetical protein
MTAGIDTKRAVFHYAAYGLGIRSDIPLPELTHATQGDDFRIRLTAPGDSMEGRSIEWKGDPVPEARFNYPGLARFVVRGGRDLAITPHPEGDITLFRLYVQGMMLASALHQRGLFVLHSSVMEVNGSAIGFMGPIGAGKSTFASAFRALGHKVVADDNAALELDGPRPLVLPAFPSVKIYPEIARTLGFERDSLRPMHASQVKEAQCVSDAFSPTRLPMRCIYVLDREADSQPTRLSPVETITEFLRHSVPTRWGVRGDGRHLKMCSCLAQMVPLFRVRTFKELSEIQTIAQRIEAHALSAVSGLDTSIA